MRPTDISHIQELLTPIKRQWSFSSSVPPTVLGHSLSELTQVRKFSLEQYCVDTTLLIASILKAAHRDPSIVILRKNSTFTTRAHISLSWVGYSIDTTDALISIVPDKVQDASLIAFQKYHGHARFIDTLEEYPLLQIALRVRAAAEKVATACTSRVDSSALSRERLLNHRWHTSEIAFVG